MKQLLAFILLTSLLCWFMFAPVYKHVLIVRQAALQKEVDVMLEIGANASHGYISMTMIEQSKQRLADIGFEPSDLIYTVHTTDGSPGTDPTQPLIRGNGLQLSISYPYDNLLQIDRLIGIYTSREGRMAAGGLKMSEYVH